jgi:Thioesterase-like superfamily
MVSNYIESSTPLFTRNGSLSWQARPETRGPFDGLQGGAIAGLLCAVAEEHVGSAFVPRSIATFFLRPTPLDPFDIELRDVQTGRRSAVIEAMLTSGRKLCARALITFTTDVAITAISEIAPQPCDPTMMAVRRLPSPHGQPWLMDVIESRIADNGRIWFRMASPLTGTESRFARSLGPIDWINGIGRPDSWAKPVVKAFPNTDLMVHMDRQPVDDWIGVDTRGSWRQTGNGRVSAQIFDVVGEMGSAAANVVLIP